MDMTENITSSTNRGGNNKTDKIENTDQVGFAFVVIKTKTIVFANSHYSVIWTSVLQSI